MAKAIDKWAQFWAKMNEAVPTDAIRRDPNVFGDYLLGQYVVQMANQIVTECGLMWYLDQSTVRQRYIETPTTFIKEMVGELVVTDGNIEVRRPGCGVGLAENQNGVSPRQIDTACKGALTDLLKNCWMRYGRFLGAELYFADPKVAALLGWKIEGRERQQAEGMGEITRCSGADLGNVQIASRGWGKDAKFGGMTLAELFEDEDGLGAMEWAAGLETPQGVTAQMAAYYTWRSGRTDDDVPGDQSVTAEKVDQLAELAAIDSTMVQIAGRNVAAKQILSETWATWLRKYVKANTGPDMTFKAVPHVINHLKAHFNAAKVMDLTGEKAAALYNYIASNGTVKDPRWYQEEGDPAKDTDDLFGKEPLIDLLAKAAPHLPEEWQGKADKWLSKLYEQFEIGAPLNQTQTEGMRNVLNVIATGLIVWPETADEESDTYKVLTQAMEKVAADGQATEGGSYDASEDELPF